MLVAPTNIAFGGPGAENADHRFDLRMVGRHTAPMPTPGLPIRYPKL